MARLCVKIDYVASLRESRRAAIPDPIAAATLVELGGADGISVHLRADRRHIQERDVELLRQTTGSRLNLEVQPSQEMVKLALHVKPWKVTLVPERPDEVVTEGGLDIVRSREILAKVVGPLKDGGLQVGILVEPDIEQIKAAHKLDVDSVELNTHRFCESRLKVDHFHAFNGLVTAAKAAEKLKLFVCAGHGLNYQNIRDLTGIQEIEEFVVGYAIAARAMLVGYEKAVRDMVGIVR